MMPSSMPSTARTRPSTVKAGARVKRPQPKAKLSRLLPSASPVKVAGARVTSKKRDMRWVASDGVVWASRFEYEVYDGLRRAGLNVRKTTEQDSIRYTHVVRQGACTVCGSDKVVTNRSYTPDLFVSSGSATDADNAGGYYIEAKGYLRGPQRSLLRSVRKERPDVDLRLVVQRDYKVGKSTLVGWATKYLKVKTHVWTKEGKLPNDWYGPRPSKGIQ